MNKNEFLKTLDKALGSARPEDKSDILYDYEEHFRMGLQEGKTEEEISSNLGDPRAIAKQFKVDCMIRQAEETKSVGNIVRAVIAALGLGFFNLVFVLGPFLAFVGVLVGLFTASIGITLGGVAAFAASVFQAPFTTQINPGASIFISIGLIAMGLLFFIGNCYVGRFFYNITISYLKMNINIIKK